MEDELFRHWWVDQTVVHPVGLAALIALSVATLVLPRRFALLPMIVLACFIPAAQRVVVGGLDFNFLRILVLVGWMRVLVRGERRPLRTTPLDVVFASWIASRAVFHLLRDPYVSTLVFELGSALDAAGVYFLVRLLVRDWRDLDRIAKSFMIVSLPTALVFLVEATTGRNLFAVFGGVPEFTLHRGGRLRCQGAFRHPILAGCFWAAVIPLIAARWWNPQASRIGVLAGVLASTSIVVMSASSTPLLGLAAGIAGACLFPLRHRLHWLRWGGLAALVLLQLLMNRPVWHLAARIDLVGGSTGWHRYKLIDQFVRRVDEWWLIGTRSTGHWGHHLWDVTNQYVAEGVNGGIVTFVLFAVLFFLAFRGIGRLLRRHEKDRTRRAFAWALGVSLLIHATNLIGTQYFGQILMSWYLAFAVIASLQRAPVRRRARRTPKVGVSHPSQPVAAPG